MDVTLTDALAEELSDTLDEVLGDLSTRSPEPTMRTSVPRSSGAVPAH